MKLIVTLLGLGIWGGAMPARADASASEAGAAVQLGVAGLVGLSLPRVASSSDAWSPAKNVGVDEPSLTLGLEGFVALPAVRVRLALEGMNGSDAMFAPTDTARLKGVQARVGVDAHPFAFGSVRPFVGAGIGAGYWILLRENAVGGYLTTDHRGGVALPYGALGVRMQAPGARGVYASLETRLDVPMGELTHDYDFASDGKGGGPVNGTGRTTMAPMVSVALSVGWFSELGLGR